MIVAVTGATGFIGRHLVRTLVEAGFGVRALVREHPQGESATALAGADVVPVGELTPETSVAAHLAGVDAVVHLAARVHQMRDASAAPLDLYRTSNTELTRSLAEDAVAAGVSRFVFLSSIKVNGEQTLGEPFTVHSTERPVDPYGVSKFEAEQALAEISRHSSLAASSIRVPMVYGPGNKGNVQRLMSAAARSLPLPLASVQNKRTMVSVRNVCAAILDSLTLTPTLPYTLRLVADSHSPSTAELYTMLGAAVGTKARTFPMPVGLLRFAANLAGRAQDVDRLTQDLEVQYGSTDPRSTWTPPQSFSDGIAELGRSRRS